MEFICRYCGKVCINSNSLRNHERLCKENPKHQENPAKGSTPWNKKYFTIDEKRKNKSKRWKENKKKKQEESFIPYKCEKCGKLVEKPYGSNRFCSLRCSCSHSISEQQKKKISQQVMSYWDKKGRKYRTPRIPKSILDMSTRTVSKILHRAQRGCMLCGWNEALCDIHHIKPRKEGGTDDNSNLVVVCPNCHRKIHCGKICVLPEVNVENLFKNWSDYYFVNFEELEKLIQSNTTSDIGNVKV